MTVFGDAVDILFENDDLARAATYMPPGGEAAIACRVITSRPDEVAELGDTRAVVATLVIDVRGAEVTPVKGGTFTIGATAYRVLAAPRRDDSDALIWRCPAA